MRTEHTVYCAYMLTHHMQAQDYPSLNEIFKKKNG